VSLSFALGGGFSFDETLLNSFSSYESEGFASLRGGGFLSSFFFHLSFSSYESEGFASLRGGGSSLMKEKRRGLFFFPSLKMQALISAKLKLREKEIKTQSKKFEDVFLWEMALTRRC